MVLYWYTPSNFLWIHAVHLTCTTKNKMNILFLRRRNTRNKNPYIVYRFFNWRQRRYIRNKNSQLGCFEFLTLRVQLVVANSRERVYFEQQILTCLLVHPTTNLSRIPGGGYSLEFLVGVCRPHLQTQTKFQTKKRHFPHPFSDLASKIH